MSAYISPHTEDGKIKDHHRLGRSTQHAEVNARRRKTMLKIRHDVNNQLNERPTDACAKPDLVLREREVKNRRQFYVSWSLAVVKVVINTSTAKM